MGDYNESASKKRTVSSIADETKVYNVGDCFGNSYSLTGSKWRPAFVVAASDETIVLKVTVTAIDNILTVSSYSLNLILGNKFIRTYKITNRIFITNNRKLREAFPID